MYMGFVHNGSRAEGLTRINSDEVILTSLRARLGSTKDPAKISARAVTSPA